MKLTLLSKPALRTVFNFLKKNELRSLILTFGSSNEGKKAFILTLSSVLTLASFSQNKTYYVSPSGSDNNSGLSAATAWKTISKVSSFAFQPTDKLLFEGGQTFTGSLSLETGKAASVYSSYGSGRAIINSGASTGIFAYNVASSISNFIIIGSGVGSNAGTGIYFYMDKNSNTSNIAIDNCELAGFRDAGLQFGAWGTSYGFNNVRVTNISAHDNGLAGIRTWGNEDEFNNTNFYFANDTAYNNLGNTSVTNNHSGNGIVVAGINGFTIEHCLAYGNGMNNRNNGGGPVGIWCYNAKNGVIQYSESHHNKAGLQADGGGFDIDGGSQNCVLQFNYSHDNEGAGYALFEFGSSNQFTNDTIRYNISENDGLKNGYGGLSIWAENSANKVSNSQVYNNVFYANNPAIGAAIGIQNTNINNVSIFNNITYCVGVPTLKGDPSLITWQKNNYYSTGTSNFTTGGTTINPGFLSPGTGRDGYKLQPTSPLIDLGLTNGSLKDFYGNATPQGAGFDIGAFEATRNSATAPSNTGSGVASYLIRAGGGAVTTSRGIFAADQYYSANSHAYSNFSVIAGTNDQALYQTQRYSTNGTMSYALPVSNGTYSVVLHFAELYWSKPGQRRFNVRLEGNKVLDNYDIVQKVGPMTATKETFVFTVNDGLMNLDFSSLASEGGVDQAIISAIEVLPATAPSSVTSYRLKAGGETLTTSRGTFAADQFYSANSRGYSNFSDIAGTTDQALYQTERYSANGTMSYVLPVSNGNYTVVMHFAELYWRQSGQRIFDVSLEGTKVLDNYDIVKKVGPLTATTETFVVTVNDGTLNVDFSALASDGGVDQAKVCAIEVLSAAASSMSNQSVPTVASSSTLLEKPDFEVIKNKIGNDELGLGIKMFPVPTTTFFNITLTGSDYTNKVTLRVFDNAGRIIEVKKDLRIGQTIQIGNTYKTGTYIIEETQGQLRKVVAALKS